VTDGLYASREDSVTPMAQAEMFSPFDLYASGGESTQSIASVINMTFGTTFEQTVGVPEPQVGKEIKWIVQFTPQERFSERVTDCATDLKDIGEARRFSWS